MTRKLNGEWEGRDIGPGLPDGLRFLLEISPVPAGAHDKCSGSGQCQTTNLCGVTCGALRVKCSLLPREAEIVIGRLDEKPGDFGSVIAGLKARHPELFPPVQQPEIQGEIVEQEMDRKSAAAGDDWVEEVSVSGDSEVVE